MSKQIKLDLLKMILDHNLKKAIAVAVDAEQVPDESDFSYEWKYNPHRKPLKGKIHISHVFKHNKCPEDYRQIY